MVEKGESYNEADPIGEVKNDQSRHSNMRGKKEKETYSNFS